MALRTEVLVIGGGATGAGVAWDAALRGFDVLLAERRDLAEGTSGRFHGLLHSGGRYVVKDPRSARECMDENRILRDVAADCIEDVGGLFVTTPWDDPAYGDRFLEGCRAAGIPSEEIPVADALRAEPRLNPGIRRAFTVPDAGIDAWKTVWTLARGAIAHGARVLPYHRVTALRRSGDAVVGADLRNELTGEDVGVEAEFTVNASGAWAGRIAALAGCEGVRVVPGKGIMIAMNHRLVNTVVNRCEMPGDGDILVPIRTVSVIGTTDEAAADPDELEVTQAEVDQMLDDGEKLVPGFRSARALRVWAGARPLFSDEKADVADTRDISRSHTLLDHRARDGVSRFLTITGGKLTTFRLMAEETVDALCSQLELADRPCRTRTQRLPDSEEGSHYQLGARLVARERTLLDDQLICECELIPRRRLEEAMRRRGTTNLDDIRRSLRLGMGPCQGGFCIYRATGILHGVGRLDGAAANAALRGFLEERWKGVWPILYGDQLRQARLDDWIFQGVLDVGHLLGAAATAPPASTGATPPASTGPASPEPSRPAPHGTAPLAATGTAQAGPIEPAPASTSRIVPAGGRSAAYDAIVIGAGLAGLTAALRVAEAGGRVLVLAKGIGSTHLSPATIDVLGYDPDPVSSPARALPAFAAAHPGHPYALLGADAVAEAIDWFTARVPQYVGGFDENLLLPTAVGAARPSAVVPETMAAGDLRAGGRLCIVGLHALKDFHAAYAADNLGARAVELDVTVDGRADVNPLAFARAFDDPAFRATVAAQLLPRMEAGERVGFPAVLGLRDPHGVWTDLQDRLGRPVFEIPTLPPSVPGMRLFAHLRDAIRRAGGRVIVGSEALGGQRAGGRIEAVRARAAGREVTHATDRVVLATGGFASGGLELDSRWQARETVIDLPVPDVGPERFVPEYFDPQPMGRAGVTVDRDLRPAGLENVVVAGAALAGAEPWREHSGEGISLATGYRAGAP